MSAFDEIGKVVHHIEDAFPPLKWALEAVEWRFDEIVKPVIEEIMNVISY